MVDIPITAVAAINAPVIKQGEYSITETWELEEFANGIGPPSQEICGESPSKTKLIADAALTGNTIQTAKFDQYARPGLWKMKLGMKAAWELGHASGNATDAHGNGNTLTANGGLTGSNGWTDFVRASTQYFSSASNSYLSPGNTKSFAIFIEVKPSSVGNEMIFAAKDHVGQREWMLGWSPASGNKIRFICFDNVEGQAAIATGASYSFTAGQEYRICAWLDIGRQTINLEINGELFSAATAAGFAVTTKTSEFRVGARQYTGFVEPFDGSIRRVRFLHRAPDPLERQLFASRSVPYVEYGKSGRPKYYNNYPYSGTVGSGSTSTVIAGVTFSGFDSPITNELVGKTLTFASDTTTVALRNDQRVITANDHLGNITVPTLDATPVSGDTFTIADPDHAILRPSIRRLTLVGPDLTVWSGISKAKGDACNGIASFASGLECRQLKLVGFPGTAILIAKGNAPYGGGTLIPEDGEANSLEEVRISNCFRGIECRDIDVKISSHIVCDNIRDAAIQFVLPAGDLVGGCHCYGCDIGVLFGYHPDELSSIQIGGSSGQRMQVETCRIGWWCRQSSSAVQSLLFFNNTELGAWLEAHTTIGKVVGVVDEVSSKGILIDSNATDTTIGGGRIETNIASGTGLQLKAHRANVRLNTFGNAAGAKSVLADASIEDCYLRFINSTLDMQFDDLAYGNDLAVNNRNGGSILISNVGDCNDLNIKTRGSGTLVITDITGYGNDLLLKAKGGSNGGTKQITIDAISGTNNSVYILTDDITDVDVPASSGTNRVFVNGVEQ